jgi:hypothetical protein
MFCTGRGEGLYWHEEISHFTGFGGVIEAVKYSIVFEEEGEVFKEFIEQLTQVRNRGGMYKEIGKLLINSFYGRLGMKLGHTQTELMTEDELDRREVEVLKYSIVNSMVIATVRGKPNGGISNVMMASAITAKARVRLHKAMMAVQRAGGRLLYVDTDSVIASFRRDVTGQRFGEVYYDPNDEHTHLMRATFAQPKSYSIVTSQGREVTKIKGMARDTVGYEDFTKAFYAGGEIGTNSSINILRSGFTLRIETRSKITQLGHYDKRRFSEDLKNTYSIKIE